MVSYTRCYCGAPLMRGGPDTVWQHVTDTGSAAACPDGSGTATPVGEFPRPEPIEVEA